MRLKDFGMIDGVSGTFSPQVSADLFARMCINRFFDMKVAEVYERSPFDCPVYLGVGEESISAALSIAFANPFRIFAQHRCHGWYLSYGGPIRELVDELLGLPTGCAKGMGGSASIHCPKIGMMGHDGHMGTQVPIGTFNAIYSKQKTLVVLGDASLEEDFVLTALGTAATEKPPVLFVCTDNNFSCITPVCVRRSWNAVPHATFGMPGIDITDDPWLIMHYVKELSQNLPAFINIRTCRISAHAGVSKDRTVTPEWDRFSLAKEELRKMNLETELDLKLDEIETTAKYLTDYVWEKRLKEIGRV